MLKLLKGGFVIDPQMGINGQADILIDGEQVKEIGMIMPDPAVMEVIDLHGKTVLPGLIDAHVHLREPGGEAKETIASGVAAAVAGGFTAVACMPNTCPVADNRIVLQYIRDQAEMAALARVYPIGAATVGSAGREMANIGEMYAAGIRGVTDDGLPIADSGLMRALLEYTKMFDLPVIDHCEDLSLAAGGVAHEGRVAAFLGLRGIPAAAESIIVARDLLLAAATGGWVHIQHVSCAQSVELIRLAKARGIRVTAEATPHHLLLTEEALAGYNTQAKVNPPLRTAADCQALLDGLREGIIDIIATDHAPHTPEEKDAEFDAAPFGINGLETCIPLLLTELVHKGRLTLEELVKRCSTGPAQILKVPGGTLAPGSPADITVIDMDRESIIDSTAFYSRSANTPFDGRRVRGLPVLTMVGGSVVMLEGRVIAR